jgi:hypothetical protein
VLQERREKELVERREKPKTNFFVRENELKKAMIDKGQMLLLVYKESRLNFEESHIPLPSLVKSLLQEFEDVFPEDMPCNTPKIYARLICSFNFLG